MRTAINTASAGGAGVYLVQGSTLSLSGNPNFGGTGIADGTLTASTGNFVSMSRDDLMAESQSGDPKNGGKAYPSDANGNLLVRQDIFIAGYQGEDGDKSVTSLVVSGSISSGAGSIWVWADQSPHYKTLQQFARIKEGATISEATLGAFRNAHNDGATLNTTGSYLYGTLEEGEDEDGDGDGYVIWSGSTGSRKVILRKVGKDASGNVADVALSGVEFTIYKGATPDADRIVVNNEDPANPKNVWTSDGTGVFFVGELPYGTYCIQERPGTTPNGYVAPSADSYKVFQIKEGEVWDATGENVITEFTM